MSEVRYVKNGNIVEDDADILVNTVNCVGVMVKGVALAFKSKWPSIEAQYKDECRDGVLKPGRCRLYRLPVVPPSFRLWAALATKDHWRNRSRTEWIESGLKMLSDAAHVVGARSIAIPPPGCGNGGLDWRNVEPMVLAALGGFDLRIYAATTSNDLRHDP